LRRLPFPEYPRNQKTNDRALQRKGGGTNKAAIEKDAKVIEKGKKKDGP